MSRFVMSINLLSCLALSSVSASSAPAAERFEFFKGVRQMGMGGAAVAVVNDETAVLSNPAGLGKIRSLIVTIADPEISLGSGLDTFGYSNLTKATDPQGLLDMMNANPGKNFHAKAQVFPSLVTTNFGIGVFSKYEVNASLDTTKNMFRLDYTNDTALAMGFNFRLFDGRVKIGVNGKLIDRVEAHKDIAPTTTNLSLAKVVNEGVGVSSDVGLILTGPWAWLPSLAGVLRDVGNTKFEMNEGFFYRPATRPDEVKTSLDSGFSLSPILNNAVRAQITGEYRDVMTAGEETDVFRRVHFGVEFNFSDVFFVRGGMNQRYWTAGIEMNMGHMQLQAASYGEEIGTATSNKEDRRYIGKFAFRF